MAALPSFDIPKLALLVVAALALSTLDVLRPRRNAGDAWSLRPHDGALADPILAVPLLLAVVAAVGGIVAFPRGSLVGPVTAVACVAIAWRVATCDDPRAAVRAVARAAALAAFVAGAYGVLQKLGVDFTPWRARREAVSTFGNTSFAAEFQAAAIPFGLFLATSDASRAADRALGGAATLFALAHLAIAMSRTDYVAVGAGLGVGATLLLYGRGRRRAATALAVAGVVAGLLVATLFFAPPTWLGRSDTIAVRRDVWTSTTRMIADEPFHVAGRSFIDRFPAWRAPDEFRTSLGRRVETPHDDFLEIAVALGVPGLLAALATVALLARRVVGVARGHAAEAATVGASLAASAVSMLASSPLSHPATALLPALCAGLVVALAPRPWRGLSLPARATSVAFAAALLCALWPGPAWRSIRSDGFLALGRAEIESGDVRRALVLLDEAASVDPQAFDARFDLGGLLASTGRHDEAIAALESAAAIRPGDLECRVNLAYALRDAGRKDEAKRLVDESLARCPWHPMSLAARAIFALEDGRPLDAARDAASAVAGLPTDPRLVALAVEASLAALGPSEDTHTAALDALQLLFEKGETKELGRFARSMLRRDPSLAGPLVTRARRLVATKRDVAAALVLAGASAMKDDAGFLDDASNVLRQAGRADESKTLLGRALGVRAAQAFDRGEDQKALKLAEQAAERDPRPAHFLVAARAAVRLGERDAAFEEVGAALAAGAVDPDELRRDPVLSTLLPDRRMDELIESAARRSGEKPTAPAAR